MRGQQVPVTNPSRRVPAPSRAAEEHTQITEDTSCGTITGTDRGSAGRVAAGARRAGRAGAWSSRAAGRAEPARAWRGRGRRSRVAPSLRCATSAHNARPSDTAVHEPLFSRRFFKRGRGRGVGADQWLHAARAHLPRAPAPARDLLFTCRILKGFSACRYGFSYARRFTYGADSGRADSLERRRCARGPRIPISNSVRLQQKAETSRPFIFSISVFVFQIKVDPLTLQLR